MRLNPLFLLIIVLTGCKVGPNYIQPKNCVPDEWVAPEIEQNACLSNEPPPTLWWEVFNEPLLNKYIVLAAYYNNDVLKAEANIYQARAMRQVSAANLYPHIALDLDAFRIFLSKNGPIGALTSLSPMPSATTPQMPLGFNIFNSFFDASWEIDFFGKTRRGIEAAQAGLESAKEQRNDILISIFAEIARNYVELRSSQIQKHLLENNVELLKKEVDIIQQRYTSGYSNLLDLQQIEIQLNQALSNLPVVTTNIYKSIFTISILTGNLPETLLCELMPELPLPSVDPCIATGIRSDLLRRRPDIRTAERNLAQATANIGVAVASFFPSLTLYGLYGLQSLKIDNLFSPNSKTWIYGADIHLPIFQGGQLVGNLRIAEAQTAAIAFQYQQTVLNAVQESETAIIAYEQDLKTTNEIRKVVENNQKLSKLSNERYTRGLTNQLDYITSKLTLNNAELSLLQIETSSLLDLVTLYKALGGGWEPFETQNMTCRMGLNFPKH